MRLHIEYDDILECIIAVMSGKPDGSLFDKYTRGIMQYRKLHPECMKLISDLRDVELDPSIADFYNNPKNY